MSILSDLDPKNARFGDDATANTPGKMSWTAPLVLFSLAGLGLGAAVYHGGAEPPVMFNSGHSSPSPKSGPLASVPIAPMSITAETQTAMISNSAQAQKIEALPEQRIEQKASATKPANPATQKKPGKKTVSSGNGSKLKQKQAKQTKADSKKGAKPSARDVEIITAIVQ